MHKSREGGYRACEAAPLTAFDMVEHGGFEIGSLAARFATATTSKEMDSVRSTADTQTRWLLSRPMREDLSKNGVDFRKLKTGDKPLTVYVILPSHYLETHSVWLRLVVSEALRASMTTGGRRTLLMLDEFAALGYLPIVERLFGVTRDYRVQMWPVFQDLPQLKGLYKERWETLLGMAGVVQSFRAGDITTAQWISDRSGTMMATLESKSKSANVSAGGVGMNTGTGEHLIEWPILKKAALFDVADENTILYRAGKSAHEMLFMPMLHQTALAPRALANPYYVPD